MVNFKVSNFLVAPSLGGFSTTEEWPVKSTWTTTRIKAVQFTCDCIERDWGRLEATPPLPQKNMYDKKPCRKSTFFGPENWKNWFTVHILGFNETRGTSHVCVRMDLVWFATSIQGDCDFTLGKWKLLLWMLATLYTLATKIHVEKIWLLSFQNCIRRTMIKCL